MAKGISKELAEEILSLEPTSKLEFYLIYYDDRNDNNFMAIHSSQNGINGNIFWQNIEYLPYNIDSSGWEIKNDQTLPRPKLVVSNKNLIVSTLLKKFDNLNNARVIRKVTYARFLDDQNFSGGVNPFGEANPNAGAPDQKYYISRVVSENREKVEFELVSPLELENQKLPNRKIHSFRCPFTYRGYGCNYNGLPVADIDNNVILHADKSTSFNADFIMTAENNFSDISNRNLGSFATEITTLGDGGHGLYTEGGSFPTISSAQSTVGDNSIYFDGTAAIIISERDNLNDFSHEANQTDRGVSFWFRMDSGENRQYIDLIDFGDDKGGFQIYLEKDTESIYYFIVGAIKKSEGTDGSNNAFVFNKQRSIASGVWYHVCFSYTNLEQGNIPFLYLYQDANLISKSQINSRADRSSLRSYSINAIGGGFDTRVRDTEIQADGFRSSDAFKGYIDDIRFFLNPISPSLAENLYNYKLGGNNIAQTQSSNKGRYASGTTYQRGDIVFIESKGYKMNSPQNSGSQGIRTYFVSTSNNNNTSPLEDSSKWLKDACGKSVRSCALRFGSQQTLPFGGFPGTHRYPFTQKQNGY